MLLKKQLYRVHENDPMILGQAFVQNEAFDSWGSQNFVSQRNPENGLYRLTMS